LVVVLAAGGCLRTTTFHCDTSDQCGADGTCQPNNFCSFPDPMCDSGQRFGSLSGGSSGQCVVVDNGGQVTVGGSVAGLTGHGLVLQDNGADDLAIAMSGAFAFATQISTGSTYSVSVSAQPTGPSQACVVANANGTAGLTDITDVVIACSTATYTLGGTVLGLSTSGLVLTDGAEDLPITASGNFAFTVPIASGAMYAVTIKTQPSGQSCAVLGGTGTIGTGNVTSVVVNCSSTSFAISGMISGLNGTTVLHDAMAGTATVNANGSWALPNLVAASSPYSVTVQTQPAYPPAAQTCVVANGSGTISSNVTNVAVTCTTNKYTIGGNVTGLAGTLVLQDNGADDKTVTASGAFTFATSLASGSLYAVTIKTQPSGQTCTLSSASGTVTNANITTVAVSCSSMMDPGILCGAPTYCPATSMVCCVTSGVPACATSCNGGGKDRYACDDAADCAAAGQAADICCGTINGSTVTETYCTKSSLCNGTQVIYCDPAAANPCPNGGTCQAAAEPTGYYWCK
jgi:hypothetical protein